jgi:hypothetical protein
MTQIGLQAKSIMNVMVAIVIMFGGRCSMLDTSLTRY